MSIDLKEARAELAEHAGEDPEAALRAGHAAAFRSAAGHDALTGEERLRALIALAVMGRALADDALLPRLTELRRQVLEAEAAKGAREYGDPTCIAEA